MSLSLQVAGSYHLLPLMKWAIGFCSIGKNETYKMPIGEWECIEMELSLARQLSSCMYRKYLNFLD